MEFWLNVVTIIGSVLTVVFFGLAFWYERQIERHRLIGENLAALARAGVMPSDDDADYEY